MESDCATLINVISCKSLMLTELAGVFEVIKLGKIVEVDSFG